MAGRFSGLHISLPGLGTILLRPSTTAIPASTSNLPPINQVRMYAKLRCKLSFSIAFMAANFSRRFHSHFLYCRHLVSCSVRYTADSGKTDVAGERADVINSKLRTFCWGTLLSLQRTFVWVGGFASCGLPILVKEMILALSIARRIVFHSKVVRG